MRMDERQESGETSRCRHAQMAAGGSQAKRGGLRGYTGGVHTAGDEVVSAILGTKITRRRLLCIVFERPPPLIEDADGERQPEKQTPLRNQQCSKSIAPAPNASTDDGVIMGQVAQQRQKSMIAVADVLKDHPPPQPSAKHEQHRSNKACQTIAG